MIPYCKKTVVGLIPVSLQLPKIMYIALIEMQFSPNARGLLVRPWNSNDRPSLRADTDFALTILFQKDVPIHQAIVTVVEEIAKERGLPMAAISTAWCLSKGVNSIVGLNSKERIDEVVKAAKLVLSEGEIAILEAAYVPKSVVGF